MILGALVDAGWNPRRLRETVRKLKLPNVEITVKRVLKSGISGTRVIVGGKDKRSHRNLRELIRIINRSDLSTEIRRASREIFEHLACVESEIHRMPKEEIHFHEIGGLDSVVDIVGAVSGLSDMSIGEVHVSKVNVGGGFVTCEHGVLPVPAPAALSLMREKPIYSSGVEKELLTPTGAAILTTLGKKFGQMPSMNVERIGYGAGRDDLSHPNLLRLMIGTPSAGSGQEKVMVIETNIDDMNPQFYDYVIENLLTLEALDVFVTPILMKKNRPAMLLTVICPIEKLGMVTEFLLRETTTLGLRWREEERARADREIMNLLTRFGKVRFKVARWEGKIVNISPEYDDCKRLAQSKKVPLKEVFEEAKRVAVTIRKN